MTRAPLKVLIIGCGQIAGGTGLPERAGEMLSHAAAYRADGRFEIAGCVDPDTARRTHFSQAWSTAAHASLGDALTHGVHYDVASICTPTHVHAEALSRLLETDTRTVLCEKPLTMSLASSKQIVAAYTRANKLLAVAYTRRWHRGVGDVIAEISSGEWGSIRSVQARYTRGIRNTGGHVIDLLHRLVGPMGIRYVGNPRYDFDPDDPTVDAVLHSEDDVTVHLTGGDGRDYGLFEVHLMTEKGMISFEDWATRIRRRSLTAFRYAPQIRTLDEGSWQDCNAGGAFEAMIDNVYRATTMGEPLACDGACALETDRLVEAIIAAATPAEMET